MIAIIIAQTVKTIVAHIPASGPKIPPDIKSLPFNFKSKIEPIKALPPLTSNPKTFP